LLSAHIGGQLNLGGATLHNPGGIALNADGLAAEQGMFCNKGFISKGEVNLTSAQISGNLDFTDAALRNSDGLALNANGLTVSRGLFCQNSFTACGEVHLVGAHIGQQVSLVGATLTNPGKTALNADGLTVGQSMICSGFSAEGEVNLTSARIARQLSFNDAIVTNPNGRALHMQDLRANALELRLRQAPQGLVEFTHAQVGVLLDQEITWPRESRLLGFGYDALFEDPSISVKARLGWLARDREAYAPQPYEQLAAAGRERRGACASCFRASLHFITDAPESPWAQPLVGVRVVDTIGPRLFSPKAAPNPFEPVPRDATRPSSRSPPANAPGCSCACTTTARTGFDGRSPPGSWPPDGSGSVGAV
jgi:hypothetical protein